MATGGTGERYLTLDVLRGVAVMGILLINIAGYALPDAAYFSPTAYGDASSADIAIWIGNFVLVDGKMRNLFSLLFGASTLLVIERAQASGGSPARVHYGRMLSLLLLGAVHFYLIWTGDILIQYATLGLLLFAFRGWSARRLAAIGVALLGVQLLVTTGFALWLFPLREAAYAPGASAEAIRAWIDWGAVYGQVNPGLIARELAIYQHDSYPELVAYRFDRLLWSPLYELALGGGETLGMMMLGMAGYRSGFLTGGWSRAAYRRVIGWGYGLGLPVMLALAFWCWASGFDMLVCFTAIIGPSALARPLIMAAHAGLVILWVSGGPSPLAARIAAAGRAAFTNYVGGSILLTTFFNGYGLGLFGQLGRAELMLVVLAIWAVMLAWSKPWLTRFRYGPFEWVWRSLARLAPQPMRRLSGEGAAGYAASGGTGT